MEVAATTPSHELVPQLQFPPGYRFVPTEEELVDVYLRAKIEGHELPLNVVNDVSILDWQPGRLVEEYKGYGENRWFFFTVREQSSSNKEKEPSRKVRVEGVTATWKATGSVQLIRRTTSKDGDKVVVGTKRVLIYNSSDTDENGKWSMHEYILKDHAEIGQYALYSIQRKQHSDTEGNAGNADMDPKKKKKKTKRGKWTETETPSTELEGVQLPHPETSTTTLLAEPPLKPTRKAKGQRKKKPSMQVGVEGEQQQQGQSPMEPVTPPKKDELVPSSQQELRQEQAAADGAPAPVVLSAVPLQAVRVCPPSEPDGTLGASAPKLEEDTLDEMSQLLALLYNHHPSMPCNNQGEEQWPPSLTGDSAPFLAAPDTNFVVDHAPFLSYQQKLDSYSLFAEHNQHLSLGENDQSVDMQQGWQHADLMFLMDDNTTQQMNSSGSSDSKHGDDQRHQVQQQQQQQQQEQQQEEESNGGAFGVVQDQQPMNHLQGGHGRLPPSDEPQLPGSDDLQVDSLLFGESVQTGELDAFLRGVLVHGDEPTQGGLAAGTQEQLQGGDDPATTLQAAGTEEQGPDDAATLYQHDDLERQLAWLRALNEHVLDHVRDGPCSCMICAAGLWHYHFPGP